VVRAEVLHGARDESHYRKLVTALAAFPQLPIPESMWDSVSRYLFSLRIKGLTVPFNDVIIAAVAIENDLELWTRDQQFTLIQPVLHQLRLFQEPS
jgi:predicted nucleic acid-binding protein